MEKQPLDIIDLKQWVLVHVTPQMAWFGQFDEKDAASLEGIMGSPVRLKNVMVLMSQDMLLPPTGNLPARRTRSVTMSQVHDMLGSMHVVIKPGMAVTMCADLEEADQQQLRVHLDKARHAIQQQRLARGGFVAPR